MNGTITLIENQDDSDVQISLLLILHIAIIAFKPITIINI